MPRPSTLVPWVEGLWQDVRHAARVFFKNPGFTAIVVISIAFGTGANVAIFSLADALLLRPLPVLRPSEVLTVGSRIQRGVVTLTVASVPDYFDIRERAQSFDGLVGFVYENAAFTVASCRTRSAAARARSGSAWRSARGMRGCS